MRVSIKRAVCGAVLSLLACGGAQAADYVFSTGSQGGSWYPLGGAIKGLVEKANPDISFTVTPGAGIANVVGVSGGKFPIAFGNSTSTVDGVEGRAPFKKAAQNVCNLGVLYPQYFQIIALKSAGVKSVADLKGKKLTTQPNGNTGELLTRELLGSLGLSYDDMDSVQYVSYKDSVSLLKDGHAEVFTLGTAVPAGAVMDLASSRDVVVVPVNDATFAEFKKKNEAFQLRMIKGGSYPGNDGDVPAISYATHMIAACDFEGAVVTAVLEAVADNLDTLAAVNKNLASLTLEEMAADIGVPLHPAAEAFYKSRGALQ